MEVTPRLQLYLCLMSVTFLSITRVTAERISKKNNTTNKDLRTLICVSGNIPSQVAPSVIKSSTPLEYCHAPLDARERRPR